MMKAVVLFAAMCFAYTQADIHFTINPSKHYIMENKGEAAIVIRRPATAPSADVTLYFHTIEGKAKSNKDFKPVKGTVVFTPSDKERTIYVPIIDDSIQEEDEEFTFKITEVKSTDATVKLATGPNESEVKVTIIDDDGTKEDQKTPTA